jgi:hypothetical protein
MTLIMFRRVPELLANGNGKGTNCTEGSLEVGALTGVRLDCILCRASSYEIRGMFTLSAPLTPSGGKSRIVSLAQTIEKELVRIFFSAFHKLQIRRVRIASEMEKNTSCDIAPL